VLLAAIVGVAVGLSSLLYYTTGIFMTVLTQTFSWSRTDVSMGVLVITFALLPAAPVVGHLCDRYGARWVASISLGFLSLGFVALAFMPGSFAVYLVIIAVMTLLASGSSGIPFTRAVNTWFDKGRGLALGLTMTGTGFGAIVAPPLLAAIMEEYGWRAGYASLAIVAALGIPIVFFNLHERDKADVSMMGNISGQHLSEAIRTSYFWILIFAFTLIAISASGVLVHFIPMLTDAGLSLQQASATFALLGTSIVVGRLIIGFLIDRFFAPRIAALAFAFTAAGCLLMASEGASVAPLTAIAIGLAIGAEMDLIAYFTAKYFGMRHYGQINGVLYASFIFGAGISPVLTGYSHDVSGTYQIALYTASVLAAASALLFLTLPRFPDVATGIRKSQGG